MKRLWLHWRDNTTGQEGWYKDANALYCDGSLPFWWEEGNGSCDCNRELFFLGDREDLECGDDRFEITHFEWREEAE